MRPSPPLPPTEGTFFASWITFGPHLEAVKIAVRFTDIASSVLREGNYSLPLSFFCTVNEKGSVSLRGSDLHTPAPAYAPYIAPLTSQLNKSFPVGNSPWEQFEPAPNETQLSIHSVPLAFLTEDEYQLLPYLHESIRNARRVSILSSPYLNPDPESRSQKSTTSVVVSVSPPNGEQLLPSISLFS